MRAQLAIGDYVRYILDDRRASAGPARWTATYTFGEVVRFTTNRVTLRLLTGRTVSVKRATWRIWG